MLTVKAEWAVVAAALAAAVTVAGQQPPPVFRARTDLVQIDVVVVDGRGQAVSGLTLADFQVLSNGRPQRIVAFQEISHEPATAAAFPPDIPLGVADNATSPDRLVVLVLDDLHFQAKTDEVKDMARRVVTDVGSRAALAVVTTAGAFGVEPTDNRASLLAEIDRFLDRFDPEMRRLAPGAMMPTPKPIVNAIDEPVRVRGPESLGRFFGDMGTYKTVKDVVAKIALQGFGRRNALVWISGGMTAPTLAQCDRLGGDAHHCGELAGLIEALRKSNVTAYGVSTGDFRSRLLQEVAELSGGFVVAPGRFREELPRLIQHLDHYYLLGIQPEGPNVRRDHDVSVTVSRPDVLVRHRRGYQSGRDAPKPKNKDPLARLSEGVLPVPDLHMRLSSLPLLGGQGRERTLITLELAAPRAAVMEHDGFLRDVVRYQVWAVDLRSKKAGRSVARQARLVLNPKEAEAFSGDPLAFQVRTVLDLPPGRYQLRASASSDKTGRSGSVFLEYEVADRKDGQLALGYPMLTYDDRQRVPIVRGGLADGLSNAAPTLDRRFSRTDVLRLLCDVVPGSRAFIDVTVDLLNVRTAASRRISAQQIQDGKPARIEAPVTLTDMEPGVYVLRVRATQGQTSAMREIPFAVQ